MNRCGAGVITLTDGAWEDYLLEMRRGLEREQMSADLLPAAAAFRARGNIYRYRDGHVRPGIGWLFWWIPLDAKHGGCGIMRASLLGGCVVP